MADDFSPTTSTSGEVAVGGTASGNIETARDRDWFAVDLVAGRTYTIDLRGSPTDDGTLSDPRLYGIHDADGNLIAHTTNDDWGGTYNSQVSFTATYSGTFYIAAGAFGFNQGTYTVEVTDDSPADTESPSDTTTDTTPDPVSLPDTTTPTDADAARAGATDLGNITALQGPRFPRGTVDGDADQVDYYRFTLTEAKQVGLGLRQQDANADLFLEDANGNVLDSSTNSGTDNEVITETLLAGTYYLRVESQAAGENAHVVRYGVSAPDPDRVTALQEQSGTAVNEAPSFGQQGYAFALAENADGSTNRVSLGTVAATDPEGATLVYALVGGNLSGSFEVDETSGELFYTGAGEDFESGTTRFTLTVRASDGSETADTTVTVDVTDVNETPTFAEASYAFDLAENTDGSTNRVSLGTLAATDPEGATLAYSLVGGNESGSFEVDATSGELFYKGSGEDFESGTTRFTLTVRANDGSETTDTTVNVNVTDVNETPVIRVADAEATEGDDSEMVFRVTLESVSTGTVTVNYATADGTATAGEDYTATSGTLTFAPGETEKTVSVAIIDDTVEDSGETFTLVLSDSTGGSLGDTEATGTIFNTEPPPARTSVSEPDGQDLPADTTTTGAVAVGGMATGNIGTARDRDWFAVDLVAGRTYTIDLRGSPTDDGTLSDPRLYGIHDADGNLISGTTNDDIRWSNLNSRVTFQATETGTYYIAAGAFGSNQGTYEVEVADETPVIRVADAEATEGDDPEMLFRVTLERASSGTVTVNYATADDTATAGEDYTATSGTLTFASGETEKTVSVAIIDDEVEDSGETFTLVLSDPSGAVLEDDSEATGTILNTEDDYGQDTTTTGEVTVGGNVWGMIGNDADRDWFKVELTAGRLYQIDVQGKEQNPLRSNMVTDMYLHGVHDSAGDLIPGTTDSNSGWWRSPRLYFDPPETGTYFIAVGSNWGTGDYRVSVTDKGVDQSADTGTTGTVLVDGTATGVIPGTGDQDWFKVSLTAGTQYRIGIEARDGGQDGCLADPALLGIHEADGDLIANTYDDNGGTGRNSLLEFTATATGDHFIAVGYGEHSLLRQSTFGPGGGFGGYTVSVDEVDAM